MAEDIFSPSLSLRVFSDPSNEEKSWKASVKDVDGDILCVSQFTLMANTTKGNKPDFHRAMVGSFHSRSKTDEVNVTHLNTNVSPQTHRASFIPLS
jgi:D-tyrosyl-tRNA(Tyr) deacylase